MTKLIDADELKKRFAKAQAYIQDGEFAEAFYAHGDNLATEWDCVEDIVDSMPTIEERKTGKWIFGETMGHSWMKCSECCVSQDGQTACFTYCPNCGAKMEGAEDVCDNDCEHCDWATCPKAEEGAE